jgi:ligand-binding sensor domain-containing protein/two-component sensor histidine kinase
MLLFMKMKFLFLLVLLSLLPALSASAQQNVRFKRLTIEDGLSQSIVEDIVQDHQGFIWIATEDGLNRYDGYTFRYFRHDPDDPTSIATNNIIRLHVDRGGYLWIGTYSRGLDRYDPRTETFTHYTHDPSNPHSLSNDRVRSISEDAEGTLWIGTLHGGLNRLEPGTDRFVTLRHDPNSENSLLSDKVRCVYHDSSGAMWIATDKGFSRYDPDRGDFTHFRAGAAGTNTLGSNNVRYILGDSHGLLWISTANGLACYDAATGRFRNYHSDPAAPGSLSNDSTRRTFEDSQGRLWVTTSRGGLNLYDRQTDSFRAWQHDQSDLTSLSHNSPRVVLEDAGGLLWVGTFGGGVSVYNPRCDRYRHFQHDAEDENSLTDPIVWTIAEAPDGTIWFGTDTWTLDRYDPATGNHERGFRIPNREVKVERRTSTRCLYWDRDGRLWTGTSPGGVDLYDPRDGSFRSWVRNDNANSLCSNAIRCVLQDAAGDMWFATSTGGLDHFDPETEIFTNFSHDPDDPHSLSSNNVISVLQDRDGDYWAATIFGVNRIVFERTASDSGPRAVITRFTHDPNDRQSISNNHVVAIFESSTGDLWFGSMQGLSRLRYADRANPVFTRYFMKDGLPNDVVYGILEDDNGLLWLSTNFGLSRFDPVNETFRNFDTRDGLLSNEFNTNALTKTAAGTFIFGGVAGASEFHPSSFVDSDFMPPIVLTGFNVFDEPVQFDLALSSLEEITLSYRDNYFSFDFASLDYSSPERNRYAYRLEGLDRNWTQAGTRHFAGYTHVDPGEYVFRVKGTNGDGIWNEVGTSIRIIITPPFWKTWWFISLLVLAVGGGVAFLVTIRVRQLLAIDRLRSKIAADLHDDIGAGLTEISIMGEIITRKLPTESRQLIQAETEKIGTTARGLVTSMSDIVWLVNPHQDSLYDLVSRLSDSFKESLDARNIRFKTESLDSLKSVRLKMEYRQHLLLIFKEAINNSLKYSECAEISLTVSVERRTLKLRLVDDGRGFQVRDDLSGNGLQNMQNRARRIGGSVAIRSSKTDGTSIEYQGPIR